ncbi:MAG: PQQ-like beta-propeller repeat protein [Actinobacteria bacterium]|nr:PQQ-like beta-propeller repeat protein [Actinomycetota bacterium]
MPRTTPTPRSRWPRRPFGVVLLAGAALAGAACSAGGGATKHGSVGAPATTAQAGSALSPQADWLTYHHSPDRLGVAGDQAPPGRVGRAWTSPALDGKVYAQPLVAGDRVVVATEGESLYALDRKSGKVQWQAPLGTPVAGDSLPCGNIDPSGVTSTPAIDPASRTVYAVAFLKDGPHHELFAVDLDSGATRWHRPIDVPGLDPKVEQARGAVLLSGGRVFVPYGGLAGDCGAYKGAVASVAADGRGDIAGYVIPTTREGGIWTPGGPLAEPAGTLLVTSGNTESTSAYDYGNAVIRLTPQLKSTDYFSPANWLELNRTDGDLGSLGPALLPDGRILIAGKDGTGYLLRRSSLGHIGGQLFSAKLCTGAYGTAAVTDGLVFVPCSDGLVAVRVGADRFDVAWRADGHNTTSPVVAAGWVWSLDGKGRLTAYDPATGAVRFTDEVGPVTHFTSAAAAHRTLVVASDRSVTAYSLD